MYHYSSPLRSFKVTAHQGFLFSCHTYYAYSSLIQGTYKVLPYTLISLHWFDIFRDKGNQPSRQYHFHVLAILNFDINCILEKLIFDSKHVNLFIRKDQSINPPEHLYY